MQLRVEYKICSLDSIHIDIVDLCINLIKPL